MKETQPRVARRTFLAGAGVVAAAAGTGTTLTTRGPTAPVQNAALPEPADVPSDNKGYRVSEHIRKYYRTTLV
ncbi:formate dehydrogenase [Cupriavidus basilensis]